MLDVKKLRELMDEKDIPSYAELSRLTGIPYTTVYYMISGHDMWVSTVIELSKFFNVPMDTLINKSYGVRWYGENSTKFINTTSLIEATVSTMM